MVVKSGQGADGAARLKEYWTHGEGANKIDWAAPGAFERCIALVEAAVTGDAKAPLSAREVQGFCSNVGLEATGARPGSKAYNEAHGHHYTGNHGHF